MTTQSKNRPRKTSAKVNVAVAGLGFMGVTHLRAYLTIPSARVVAVCDPARLPVGGVLPGVAGNIKKSGDVHLGRRVKMFRQLDELLADPEIDLVDLCTPTPLHAGQAIAALKAGKHVLCEKPLARTAAEARQILQVAESSPGFLMPALCMRFWPGWSWLKQTIEQGVYGKMLAARFQRVSEKPAWSGQSAREDRGGALLDLHIHDTDFVQFICGRPKAVFSTGVTDAAGIDRPCRDAIYLCRRPGGLCRGKLAAGGGIQHGLHHSLRARHAGFRFRAQPEPRADHRAGPPRPLPPLRWTGRLRRGNPLLCGLRGRPPAPGLVTARDAVTALEICEAEEKSLRTGSLVKL